MSPRFVLGACTLVFATVTWIACSPRPPSPSEPSRIPVDGTTACTQEAKVCPDGTAVSRTGPRCEFAACPGEDGGAPPR